MPSYEGVPAERPRTANAELINAQELPTYEPLPELTPDQATELLKTGRVINALNDVDEIIKALPNDMHGKKEAIRALIGAVGDLITSYKQERTDTAASESFTVGWTSKMQRALADLGYRAPER